MKYFLLFLVVLIPGVAVADDASHLAAAESLIDLMGGQQVMRDAFVNTINAMNTANSRISPAEADDMKTATIAWFDEDFKWEDLRPQLAAIYMKSFTEDELTQLLAFYKTPLGKKTLAALPEVMKDSMVLGQQYAQSKQATLMTRLQKVDAQYHPTAPAPGDASSPAATSAAPAASATTAK